ncbi:putative bifunctional diguanylate cyclase/phosphodiesterase [Histidinibacterium aquaticum]|uniref:putative bifunctional diguanylate cyclase/phosphodiesterase n=1 Tax=Histidinibacterium aquaticum TaxID=2613962 RepID=UPI00168B416D|nr:bifunctional diguanylate cyclase/phosphodiesterase [Histidinibacterium aquaticum]
MVPIVTLSAWMVFQQPGFLIAAFLLPALLAVGFDRRPAITSGDQITGLDLQETLLAVTDEELRQAARSGSDTTVLVIEIDGFKRLEERLGRPALDDILRSTARRLLSSVRDLDTCARLEGPTFAVVIGGVMPPGRAEARDLARRLQEALSRPVEVEMSPVPLTVSVGYACASDVPGATGAALLQSARLALIHGQRAGPSALAGFGPEMRSRVARRGALARQAARALEAGEILPWFQPQVSATSGRLVGVEALARWPRAGGRMVPPAAFLPALEEAGLTAALGRHILFKSAEALSDWREKGLQVGHVGLNLAPADLTEPDLAERVATTLRRLDLPPEALCIEVLETVVAGQAEDTVVATLKDLARLGCRLDLDDFGTGHAAITSIRHLPVHRLKIDRSFITGVDRDPDQQRMLSAILIMAERLGLETLAEGVETEGEIRRLAEMGCGALQGFAIARPMPFDQATDWIAARPALAAPRPEGIRRIG